MHWNHRMIKFKEPGGTDTFLKFAEVFYNDDGTLMGYHEPFLWSEDAFGMQELAEQLLIATTKRAIDESEFPKDEETENVDR